MGWQYGLDASGAPVLTVSFTQSKGPVAAGLMNGQCAFSDSKVRMDRTNLCLHTKIQLLSVTAARQVYEAAFGPNYLNNFLTVPGKLYFFWVHEAPANSASPPPGNSAHVPVCLWVDKYGP
jgi:hypothetical protein